MHYNADDYLAAQEPPRYTHHGCTYYGRILSFDQWVAVQQRTERLSALLLGTTPDNPTLSARAYVHFRTSLRAIVDAVFPKRCRIERAEGAEVPRRGWIVTRPARVSELLEELPLAAQLEAIKGFTRSLETMQTPPAPGATTTTEATDSTSSTGATEGGDSDPSSIPPSS